MRGDKPINTLDAAALIHDIEYTSDMSQQRADRNMENNLAAYNDKLSAGLALIFFVKNLIGYDVRVNNKIALYMKYKSLSLLINYPKMRFELQTIPQIKPNLYLISDKQISMSELEFTNHHI